MCCTEFFNKSDEFSQSFGVLLIYFSGNGGCILKSLNKNADCCSAIVKSMLLSCGFEATDIGSKSCIVLLLYLHKVGSISVDVFVAEFQSKDALDFIPALSCLGGLMDECAGEA